MQQINNTLILNIYFNTYFDTYFRENDTVKKTIKFLTDMRTRELLKYLVVMIMALNTSFNAMAQKNLKIFFKTAVQDVENNNTPRFQLGGDVPAPALGLVVKPEGVRWANGYRFFSGWHGTPTDRLIAAYVDENTKMDSKLKISFENFPFEVNAIQWNVMNDLMSGAIFDFSEWDSDIFDNYTVNYKYTPKTGNAITGSEQHWDLNPLPKRTDFNRVDMPGASNMAMNGLTSFEFSEENYFKIGFLWWSIYSQKTALNDNCRTFLKAGWKNGMVTLPADDWAFNIKYSLPELGLRFADGRTNNTLIVDENDGNGVSLQAYISAHAGAIEPGKLLTNYNKFCYEYVSSNTGALTIDRLTGKVYPKKAGAVDITVNLMYGKGNEGETIISSYTKTLQINEYNINESSPKICIGFVDGNKGYDIMVGDKKAQIQGFITANTPSDYSTGGYQFEYYESSNGEIITIDPATGKITPKKEGDVDITAVLKKGSKTVSNPYTYTLHVFAKVEGVNVTKHESINSDNELLYHYYYSSNFSYWEASRYYDNSYVSIDWKPTTYLRPSTSIQENSSSQSGAGTDGWKEFARYKTTSANYWRAITQKICFDLKIPKYSTMEVKYSFAGNLNIGAGKGTNVQYGFEVLDLGNIKNNDLTGSNKAFNDIEWNTYNTGENVRSAYYKSLGQKAISSNGGYVGDGISNIDWSYNKTTESDFGVHRYYTHYVAVMAYLYRNGSYPGEFSVGYKGIPTYTYYTKVTYAKNDGTGTIVRPEPEKWVTTTSKTETFKLFQGASNSEKAQLSSRAGYTFLGWSTDPNATTPEYGLEDDFPIYDNVNGGGMGHVTLYAVWKPNNYIVTLHKNDGGEDETAQIEVTYEQPMPENIGLVAPTRKGYDFTGYHNASSGSGKYYYDANMKSVRDYDQASDYDLYARWFVHNTEVRFDPNGGVFYNNVPTVTATYNQQMPIVGVYEGNGNIPIPAPSRTGYTFAGYYYPENGTTYYKYSNATISSAKKWDIDERTLDPQVEYVTLYAKWIPDTYTVTLDPQGGEGGSTSTTATYDQPLPSGLTAPTKVGYEFRGYYSSQNDEWQEAQGNDSYNNDKQYYDKDMVGVEPWDIAAGATIYAHWAPKTYIVTFDLGDESHAAIFPDNVVNANKDRIMEITSDGKMKVSFDYGISGDNSIDLSVPKKPGYEMLGWYDANEDLIVTVDSKDRHAYITDKNNYWQKDGNNVKWNYADDLVLTAKFRCKYTVEDAGNGPIIKFDNEIVEPDQDWLSSVISDLQGAAKEVGTPENPVMAFDLRTSKNIWTDNKFARLNVMESLQSEEYKDYISPNVLVYFNDNESEAWYIDGDKPEYQGRNDADCYNAVSLDNKCRNLVVTDRYRIKIPYEFKAGKALYERNKYQINTDDPMWVQSHESMWGTLCLPYPVKNNNKHNLAQPWEEEKLDCHVVFYELRRKSGNVMQFYKLPEDAVIPANTPVMYERRVGVSSAVIIEEVSEDVSTPSITVPMNRTYAAETKTYDKAILNTEYDWQFIGNMEETTFYGKNCKSRPAGVIGETKDVIYYFKKDNFTRMGDANYMILYPYRAYFREVGAANSDSKVASYSILVIDDEGATDITNAIFGDGEGDGKIYDLNGVRVKQPVRGRLYIVNGKKKVYE